MDPRVKLLRHIIYEIEFILDNEKRFSDIKEWPLGQLAKLEGQRTELYKMIMEIEQQPGQDT